MENLTADLPQEVINGTASQPISGDQWRDVVRNQLISQTNSYVVNEFVPARTFYDYNINFGVINNSLLNPYPKFEQSVTVNGRTYQYEEGALLGAIEFTATYRSATSQNLTIPIIQRTQLFFPAVPVLAIQNSEASIDNTNPSRPIPLFCEASGNVNVLGFPAPQRGSSTGNFVVVDELTGTALPTVAYRDNENGTLTIFPGLAKNNFRNIRIIYTYQQNGIPCASVAEQVLRFSPNPLADFSVSTLCEDAPVQFTDLSTVQTVAGVSINKWEWEFADPNSNANTSTLQSPQHIYSQTGLYPNVSLRVATNQGCSAVNAKTANLQVGGTPDVKFNFTGVSVADNIVFQSSSSVSSNDRFSKVLWTYGDGATREVTYTAANQPTNPATTVQHQYQAAGAYNVTLTVTSAIGCVNNLIKKAIVLPRVTVSRDLQYLADFETGNGGWQAQVLTGDASSWEHGTPISSVFTLNPQLHGTKVWKTNLDGGYNALERSALFSPSFNISDLNKPMVSFQSYVQLAASDGVVVQYSIDDKNVADPLKTWFVLGAINQGVDWYNARDITAKPGDQKSLDYGWSGSDILQWRSSRLALFDEAGKDAIYKANRVVFRFALASDKKTLPTEVGFVLDNFRIGERTRTLLLEHFSNTSNTTTDAGGLNLEKRENDNIRDFKGNTEGIEVIKINYHLSLPNQDPFNQDNPTEVSARALYYNLNTAETPYARLDGKHSGTAQQKYWSNWGSAAFEQQSLQLARAQIVIRPSSGSVTPPFNESTYTANGKVSFYVDIIPSDTIYSGTLLHTGVLEKLVPLASLGEKSQMVKTGETSFNYILKKFLPQVTGTKIKDHPSAVNGNLLPGTTSSPRVYTFGPFEWIPEPSIFYAPQTEDLAIVVFLQNELTREVLQSELINNLDDPVQTITGLEDETKSTAVIYPNPASEKATLQIEPASTGKGIVRVFDQSGRLHHSSEWQKGQSSEEILTNNLAAGVYVIELVFSDDYIIRKKLVVIH